jgi:hypothetical protein
VSFLAWFIWPPAPRFIVRASGPQSKARLPAAPAPRFIVRASGPQSKARLPAAPADRFRFAAAAPAGRFDQKKIHLARIIFPPKIHHTTDKNICKGFALRALKNKIPALEARIFFFNARNAADVAGALDRYFSPRFTRGVGEKKVFKAKTKAKEHPTYGRINLTRLEVQR